MTQKRCQNMYKSGTKQGTYGQKGRKYWTMSWKANKFTGAPQFSYK